MRVYVKMCVYVKMYVCVCVCVDGFNDFVVCLCMRVCLSIRCWFVHDSVVLCVMGSGQR